MAMGGANAAGANTGATPAPAPTPGVNPTPIQNPYAPVGGGMGFGQPTQMGLGQAMQQQPTGGKGGGENIQIPPQLLQSLQGVLQGTPNQGGQPMQPTPSAPVTPEPAMQPPPQPSPQPIPQPKVPPKMGGIRSLAGKGRRR